MFTLTKKTILAFFLLMNGAGFAGYGQEPASRLTLNAQADKAVYKQGELIAITLLITNHDTKEVKLFHPDILGKSWWGCDWDLSCQVIRPDGTTITLEPDVRLQALYPVQAQHFKTIAAGQALQIPLRFKGNKVFDPIRRAYSSTDKGDDWIGLIAIGPHKADISDEDVRRRWGIKGDYHFISGINDYIAVEQLLADVFNAQGQYQLDFAYANNCNFASSTDRQGVVDQWDKVTDAWTGRLAASVMLQIEK